MERLDRAMEGIRRKAEAWEIAELSRMESTLDQAPPAFYKGVPPPGYCHPYHEQRKRFIIDWLDGKSSIGGHHLRLPVVERVKFSLYEAEVPVTIPESKVLTMRQEKAYATAPYVGRPFVYWWRVGVDDHGRGVGGTKTTLAHTDTGFGEWQWTPYVTGVHAAEIQGGWHRYTTCLRCGQGEHHEIHQEAERG